MLRPWMIVWAVAASMLPLAVGHAADSKSVSPVPTASAVLALPLSGPATSAVALNLRILGKPAGLVYRVEGPAPFLRQDDFRFDLADRLADRPAHNLALSGYSLRNGWHFSGSLGPWRWLTPLQGEGETRFGFGRRFDGQPRVPGAGSLNMSIHYNFH